MIPMTPEYEDNIMLMRSMMRENKYLSDPSKSSDLRTLSKEKIDDSFSKIIDLAKEQKKENVFAVIKTNDFTCGFKKRHCDLFSSNTRKPDYDEQIKIFIGSLDNSEQKWSLHEYWQNSKKHSDYRGQKFLDDLIENKAAGEVI